MSHLAPTTTADGLRGARGLLLLAPLVFALLPMLAHGAMLLGAGRALLW